MELVKTENTADRIEKGPLSWGEGVSVLTIKTIDISQWTIAILSFVPYKKLCVNKDRTMMEEKIFRANE